MSERVKKWVKFWLGGGASWRTGRAFALCTITGVAEGLSAVGFNALFELCRHGILGTLGGFAPHEAQGEVPLFFGASAMRPRWWILWALPALGALLASVIGRWFCPQPGGTGWIRRLTRITVARACWGGRLSPSRPSPRR